MDYSRALNLDKGVAMVVTDLHGEWEPYARLRDTFVDLNAKGQADHLIFCGDLIHTTRTSIDDNSLKMLCDVMALQDAYGSDTVIMLAGNHELPHIYDVIFSKGNAFPFNGPFEWEIERAELLPDTIYHRDAIKKFLLSLPFYVRTKAGVTLSHAGAPPFVKSAETLEYVLTFDHDALLRLGQDAIQNRYDLKKLKHHEHYRQQVYEYLAVSNVDDIRYTNLLRGQYLSDTEPLFRLVWDTLFVSGETTRGQTLYLQDIVDFLAHMSTLCQYPQSVLTMGHVVVNGGYKILGQQLLRFASYPHATPPDAGVYLLLDCAKPVSDARELVKHLHKTIN